VCNVGTSSILDSVSATARGTLETLSSVPEFSREAASLALLLDSSEPIIMPQSTPLPGQLTSRDFLQCEPRSYPSLLQDLAGPPLRLGRDPLLGFVTAECALSALRQGEVQAALSALILTTLCATRLEEPAIEALHHMLVERDPQGSIGLFEIGGRRSGIPADEMLQLRHRNGIRFVAAAVQLHATFRA
jgi:hypothetical protein